MQTIWFDTRAAFWPGGPYTWTLHLFSQVAGRPGCARQHGRRRVLRHELLQPRLPRTRRLHGLGPPADHRRRLERTGPSSSRTPRQPPATLTHRVLLP